MKDQVQIPFDTRDASEQGKENKPKALSRPALPQGMEKPRVKAKPWLRRRCNCGDWNCTSPATGQPPGYYWQYFDEDGVRVNARDNNLPLTGDGVNSSHGWRLGSTAKEQFKLDTVGPIPKIRD